MSEQQSKPEAEVQKPDKQEVTRRGFFQLFRKSKSDDKAKESDASEKPDKTKITFKEKLKRQLIPTRRQVLIALGTVTAFIAVDSGPAFVSDINTNDDYDYEVLGQMDFLKKRYGCEIEFGMPLHLSNSAFGPLEELDIRFGYLNLKEKKSTLNTLREQLALYPPELLQKISPLMIFTKYKSISLSAGYTINQSKHNIVFMHMPFETDCPCTKKESAGIIHHELYHAFDYESGADDITGLSESSGDANNEEWEQLNKGEVDYKSFWNIRSIISAFISGLTGGEENQRPRGFADDYGESCVDEDEATVAGHLMSNHIHPKNISENDPILKSKIEKIKEYMFRWSNGRMNEQYWKDLAEGEVNEGYWDAKSR